MAATLPNPTPTLFGAIKNIGRGIYQRTAKFAGYGAAVPTATTAQGSRIGTNPNSTSASVQRVGMQFTAEMVAKNSAIGAAYLAQRVNYCSSSIDYVPHTGDTGLDREIKQYLQGSDGVGGYFSTMGVDCSMQDAFSRTADIETPVRGDAGLIFWRDALDNLRLIEFSADQLGEVYQFTMPRPCSIARDAIGQLYECSGSDCIYFAGRYFRGADCIAYKIYERTNAWYGNPQIYDADDVIYFRDPASFRGVRGVTKFANALQHMQKGEDMLQAALSAAQRQARTAGRVFNNSGGPASGYGSELIQGDPNLGGDMIKYFEREPGGPMVEYFYNGDNAEFVNPTAPGPELIAGVEVNDERVAIALGLNYAFLISATKVGGAPSRLEIEKADKELQRIQRTIHRPRLNTIRDRVLMDAMRRGEIRKPFGMTKEQFLRGNWQLPISPSVDAFYDAKENISMVRAGMEAAQDVIAETNRNWEDVLEKNAQWAMKCSMVRQDANKKLIEAGYKPDITPADIAQVSDNPQQSAAAENIEQGKPAAGGSQPQATAQQTAQFAEHDVSDEKRDESGKWTSGGGSSEGANPNHIKLTNSKVLDETDKARKVKVQLKEGSMPIWIPKSHSSISNDGTVHAAQWVIDAKHKEFDTGFNPDLHGEQIQTGNPPAPLTEKEIAEKEAAANQWAKEASARHEKNKLLRIKRREKKENELTPQEIESRQLREKADALQKESRRKAYIENQADYFANKDFPGKENSEKRKARKQELLNQDGFAERQLKRLDDGLAPRGWEDAVIPKKIAQ